MYLRKFWINDSQDKEIYSINFVDDKKRIQKWTNIQKSDPLTSLFIKLLCVCLGGGKEYLSLVNQEIVECLITDSKPIYWGIEFHDDRFKTVRVQFETHPDGMTRQIFSHNETNFSKGFDDIKKPLGSFAYGYNPIKNTGIRIKQDKDFAPRLRSSRFETIFNHNYTLTPVDEWLYRQYRNASQYNSKKAESLYNISVSLITELYPDISFFHSDEEQKVYFKKDANIYSYLELPLDDILFIHFVIDFIRQMSDSKRGITNFNYLEGILIISQLEKVFRSPYNLRIFSEFFPNIQFIFKCGNGHIENYINNLHGATVPSKIYENKVKQWLTTNSIRKKSIGQYRNLFRRSRFTICQPASEDTVVLVDVDSHIPNLALMKLSRFYKNQGRKVILVRDSSDHYKSQHVFASCVFRRKSNQQKIKKLLKLHGENLQIGGSGVDLLQRLPKDIESLMPDYSLYPNMDFALGFITRGCPKKCKFCVVPIKEGNTQLVATIDDIVPPERKKLVILDDNLLSYPASNEILKQIIKKELQVNFNQTLDISYLNSQNAELLIKIDSRNYSFTKSMYYFSLNFSEQIPMVKEKIKLLKSLRKRQMIFVCMYGYNTTLSGDLARFQFLCKFGLSPFVQQFQPISDSPIPVVKDYFDTDIEPLLQIKFHFNGKNFENYLKWVSKRYIQEFGEIYMPLVDLIFKYNNKQYKHRYIETLGGTRKV